MAALSSRTATAIGFGAVLLWSTLAPLTALKGPAVPPFQTTAITFAIGGGVVLLAAAIRGRLAAVKPTFASFVLGLYGLFVYHALYFAALRLAPPAEAGLISSMWALFTVLFSGALPGHRLEARHVGGAILGLAAAALLSWGKLGIGSASSGQALGLGLALACAVVWASYSVLSRLAAAVPSESLALPCIATAVLAGICNAAFEGWSGVPGPTAWAALVLLGAGPVGLAFVLWDIGMKRGNVAQLGVLAYASPIISTTLLVALGLTEPKASLAIACLLMVAAAWIATRER